MFKGKIIKLIINSFNKDHISKIEQQGIPKNK